VAKLAANAKQYQISGIVRFPDLRIFSPATLAFRFGYPRQDMGIVVESFEIKMARAISETRAVAQSQSRGIRV